jgi:DME family drug/metabolite transporter
MDSTGLLFAISSTLLLGSNKLAVRKSLLGMNESLATLFSIVLAIPIFGIPLLIYGWGPKPLSLEAIAIFGVTGIVNYSVGRWLIYKCIGLIGANRGNILGASQTVYAIVIALTFLGQTINALTGAGIVLVLLGIAVISYRKGPADPGYFTKRQLKLGLVYGVIGAFFWGLAQDLMQVGIKQYSNPTGATFLTYSLSLIGILPLFLMNARLTLNQGKNPLRIDRKSFAFVVVATLMGSFAQFFRYNALVTIPVTIVATVNGSNPLFTLVFSYMFIRQIEFIDRRTVLGIITSVAGVILVTF